MVLEQQASYMQKNEVGPLLQTIYTNELKMDHKTNILAKTTKFLEESIQVNLCHFGLGKGFLDIITKAQMAKEKIDKLHFLKIKTFLAAIRNIKKVKIQCRVG